MLAAIYVPAFVFVSIIRPPLPAAILTIIGVSLMLALAVSAVFWRHNRNLRFGFRLSSIGTTMAAIAAGIALAGMITVVRHTWPARAPVDFSTLTSAFRWFVFGLAAPVQEEVIFRGVVQTRLASRLIDSGGGNPAAIVLAGLAFGCVHFEGGVATAVSALALGCVCGYFRYKTNSLVPAVIIHAICNLPELAGL